MTDNELTDALEKFGIKAPIIDGIVCVDTADMQALIRLIESLRTLRTCQSNNFSKTALRNRAALANRKVV